MLVSERQGKIRGEEKIFKEITVGNYSNLLKFMYQKNSKKNSSRSHINED